MNHYACEADEHHMAWEYEWRRRLCVAISTCEDINELCEDINELWQEYGYTFRCHDGDAICRSARMHAGCETNLAIEWI